MQYVDVRSTNFGVAIAFVVLIWFCWLRCWLFQLHYLIPSCQQNWFLTQKERKLLCNLQSTEKILHA
mgnify:CR=1 FL=1